MNWQAISFDWNQVRAVLATVETGSFSGAARALRTTQPTVGRQVSGLEEALGITVFERTARGPMLTDAGRELLEYARSMGEAATHLSMVATSQSEEVSGEVSVTCSDLLATVTMPEIVMAIRKAHPGILVRLVVAADIKNLTLREADIAVRHVAPEGADLIAKRLPDFKGTFYAAKTYLESAPPLASPIDLPNHALIGTGDLHMLVARLAENGIALTPENFATSTDSGPAMLALAQAGAGLALLPETLGEADPLLTKAMPAFPSFDIPVWLVTHRELRTSPRIRVVFDTLARELPRHGIPA